MGAQIPGHTLAQVMVALAAVAGAVTLGILHDLDGQVVAAILTGALALAGGSAIASGAVNTAINGKTTVSPELLATMQETLRQTIDHLSGARNTIDDAAAAATPPPAQAPMQTPPPGG